MEEKVEMARKSRLKSFSWGAILGGLAAGATALLFAPKSGKKLRADIKNKYHDLSDKSHDVCDDICERGKEFAKDTKKAAKRFMRK